MDAMPDREASPDGQMRELLSAFRTASESQIQRMSKAAHVLLAGAQDLESQARDKRELAGQYQAAISMVEEYVSTGERAAEEIRGGTPEPSVRAEMPDPTREKRMF